MMSSAVTDASPALVRPVGSASARRSAAVRGALWWYQLLAGLVLALVWLRSSAAHLSNPYYFLSSIFQYELVGPMIGSVVAAVAPGLQLILAVCLFGRLFVAGALLISAGLLAAFAGVQGWAMMKGLNISCGCFGAAIDSTIGQSSLTMTGGMLGLAVTALGALLLERRLKP